MAIALEAEKTLKDIALEEFLAQPETKPASELVDGQITVKPMPKFHHSILQSEIIAQINKITKPIKSAYAFPELRCNFSAMSIVPDIVVLRWQNIPFLADGAIADVANTVPNWLIEILSPEQSPLKVMNKLGLAITNGAELGWLIIPHKRSILVYTGDDIPEMKQGDDLLPVLDVVQGWQITPAEVLQMLVLG